MFEPKKIIDPHTGKERVVSPEEQIRMLENGVIFDVPEAAPVPDEPKKETI